MTTSSDRNASHPNASSETLRNPSEWKTGDEPITTAQKSYLETLAREAGEDISATENLTKAEAAVRIEELQKKTGRQSPATGS